MPLQKTVLDHCATIAREFGATRLILFGSGAESPETVRDLDPACERVEEWDVFRLAAKLEVELKTRVDLVPLRPSDRFARQIAARGRVTYEDK